MIEGGTVFLNGRVRLFAGDCLEVLATLPENSVDAVVTDPPYHLKPIVERFGKKGAAPAKSNGATGVYARASAGFMGQQWDGGDIAFRPETWAAVLRVLKPGGHMAAFSAPRCVHRMAVAIEDAGFIIRDRIVHLADTDPALDAFVESLTPQQADALARLVRHFGPLGEALWTYGQGFPKSHDVSKAIDKMAGAEREVIAARRKMQSFGTAGQNVYGDGPDKSGVMQITAPATPEAAQWEGWGTALKPAYEPIVIARKPLAEGSVAAQVLATGTGGINIAAGQIGSEGGTVTMHGDRESRTVHAFGDGLGARGGSIVRVEGKGRHPANLAHDGSAAVLAGFPEKAGGGSDEARMTYGIGLPGKRARGAVVQTYADSGSAARFFFSPKAGRDDRLGSKHPTVKPVELMQWLVRMLVPPGGTVLDPFSGSGSTGEAAWREGFNAVLIEREAAYCADIARRMELCLAGPATRKAASARKAAAPAEGLLAMLEQDAAQS